MPERLRIDVDNGKYTIVQPEDGQAYALRYGEPWLSAEQMTGTNMILAMAYELDELRAKLEQAETSSAVGLDALWLPAEPPPAAGRYGQWDVFLLGVRREGVDGECFITGRLDPRGWFDVPAGYRAVRYIWIASLTGSTSVG